jgi:S1-C subfamily serine protease
MMRISRYILMIVLMSNFMNNVNAQENLPALIKNVKSSVVVILAYDSEDKLIIKGSGFLANKQGDVVTNRHLLEEAATIKIKTMDGNIYPVNKKNIKYRPNDIAFISIDCPIEMVHYLTICDTLPQVGERIVVIGNPLGLEGSVTDGIVSAIRELEVYGTTIQITAPLSEGSSGSPVFNMKGEVIGIATFQMTKGQNLNFSIPLLNEKYLVLNNKDM